MYRFCMVAFPVEMRIKALAYADAVKNEGFINALRPDGRPAQELETELKDAASNGDVALAAGDTIHLLRRGLMSPTNAATAMAGANHEAGSLYAASLAQQKSRHVTGLIDWMRREMVRGDLEVAVDQLSRREGHWNRLAAEASQKENQ